MSPRPFVVTGCARSGTGYTASLLSALGVRCSHEALFSPYTTRPPTLPPGAGEASWLAVPFLPELPDGSVVLHQVREPGHVVASLLALRFFDDAAFKASRDATALLQVLRARGLRDSLRRAVSPRRWRRGRRLRRDFVDFVRRHCPEIFHEQSERRRAERYWVEWNRAAARADRAPHLHYFRYRLEDLDAELVVRILARLDVEVDSAKTDAALASLPRTTNTRQRPDPRSFATPATLLTASAKELASDYGYET